MPPPNSYLVRLPLSASSILDAGGEWVFCKPRQSETATVRFESEGRQDDGHMGFAARDDCAFAHDSRSRV